MLWISNPKFGYLLSMFSLFPNYRDKATLENLTTRQRFNCLSLRISEQFPMIVLSQSQQRAAALPAANTPPKFLKEENATDVLSSPRKASTDGSLLGSRRQQELQTTVKGYDTYFHNISLLQSFRLSYFVRQQLM